jgi:hypothetical protein
LRAGAIACSYLFLMKQPRNMTREERIAWNNGREMIVVDLPRIIIGALEAEIAASPEPKPTLSRLIERLLEKALVRE